jgi:hypothetical protein
MSSMQAQLPLAFDTPLFRLGGATITLTTLLAVAAVLVGCAIAVAVVEMGARRMARREAGNASALYAGSRIARYAIWIAGSFLAISVAGIDLGGLAFLAGALGVGIGFGLQNVVNNFVCGIVILLEGTLRIGDFVDEHDVEEDSYIKALPSGDFIVKALTPVDDFNEFFEAGFSEEEFDTIGGVVMSAFGHLPKRNEVTDIGEFRFRVISADSRRIHLLRLTPLLR